jgi:hypothetical protein
MSLSPSRPDLAFTNATRLEPAVLVKELRELLGAKLVAYLGGRQGDPCGPAVGGGNP